MFLRFLCCLLSHARFSQPIGINGLTHAAIMLPLGEQSIETTPLLKFSSLFARAAYRLILLSVCYLLSSICRAQTQHSLGRLKPGRRRSVRREYFITMIQLTCQKPRAYPEAFLSRSPPEMKSTRPVPFSAIDLLRRRSTLRSRGVEKGSSALLVTRSVSPRQPYLQQSVV